MEVHQGTGPVSVVGTWSLHYCMLIKQSLLTPSDIPRDEFHGPGPQIKSEVLVLLGSIGRSHLFSGCNRAELCAPES